MKLSLATIGSLLAAYAAAAPVSADDGTNQALETLAENAVILNNEDHGDLNKASEEVKKTVDSILEEIAAPEKRDGYIESDKAGVANVAALNNDLNHIADVGKRDEGITQGLEELLQGVLDEVKGLPETVESLVNSVVEPVGDLVSGL